MNRNLIIPMLIHLLFNFLLSLLGADALRSLSYEALLYFVFAVILAIAGQKAGLGAGKSGIESA